MTRSEELAARVFSRNPKERKLLNPKHLVLVGLGSVGGALATMAARAGVGRFTLIDLEVLAPENVGRHICDLGSCGRAKVEAVSTLIYGINPQARVRALAEDYRTMDRDRLATEVDEHALLVASTDSFECQSLVNLLSLETGAPAVYVGCWGEATVGEILYVVPGKTPCYECYASFRHRTEDLPLNDPRRYTDLEFDQTRVPGQAGLWPNILIICGFAFQLILALLGREDKRCTDLIDFSHTLFLVNVGDFASALQPWTATPASVKRGCAVCDEACLSELESEAR